VGLLQRMPKMKTKLLITAMASVAAFSATSASAQSLETVREVVEFNFNSALSAEVQAQLQNVANTVLTRGASSVRVTCHTDTVGSTIYNQGLSERRADAGKSALIALGVPADIISAVGVGETQPLIPTGDNVKEQANRVCTFDTDFEPFVQNVQQDIIQTQDYIQTQPRTETVTEYVRGEATPIESIQQTRTITSQPEVITRTVTDTNAIANQATTIQNAPVIQSAPVVNAPTLPIAGGTSGGGFGSSGLITGAAGIAAGVGLGLLVDGGGVSDDEFAAAQAAQAAAEAQAAADAQAATDAAAAQAEAEAAAAAAAQAQADAEAALADAVGDNDAPGSQ